MSSEVPSVRTPRVLWNDRPPRAALKSPGPRVPVPSTTHAVPAAPPEMIAEMKKLGQAATHGTHGRFIEVQPMERLAITHVIDFIAGVAPYDHTMVVELFPSGDQVRMVVTIDPHVDESWTRMATEGFTSQLGKLDRRFNR